MAIAKLHYDGNSYTLDWEKVSEFLDDLRHALLSEHTQIVDVPLTGNNSLLIAVGPTTPVAVEQNSGEPKPGRSRPGRMISS